MCALKRVNHDEPNHGARKITISGTMVEVESSIRLSIPENVLFQVLLRYLKAQQLDDDRFVIRLPSRICLTHQPQQQEPNNLISSKCSNHTEIDRAHRPALRRAPHRSFHDGSRPIDGPETSARVRRRERASSPSSSSSSSWTDADDETLLNVLFGITVFIGSLYWAAYLHILIMDYLGPPQPQQHQPPPPAPRPPPLQQQQQQQQTADAPSTSLGPAPTATPADRPPASSPTDDTTNVGSDNRPSTDVARTVFST
ncbi:hypothetical protein Hypma_014268 [Hypsizygus marmoreus]|uniref:Uncharacterized protein n=1 Tax=Hypsizygus marmoreus TaxID=39966 RepID=A0A369JK22_HYPMA|nr:hypothetical protein Hypma_014268 [Hypsizygus marmoreus]